MEITEEMYEKIAHLFPKQKSPPKISNLEVLNAILKVLENGSKWRSLGKIGIRFTLVQTGGLKIRLCAKIV